MNKSFSVLLLSLFLSPVVHANSPNLKLKGSWERRSIQCLPSGKEIKASPLKLNFDDDSILVNDTTEVEAVYLPTEDRGFSGNSGAFYYTTEGRKYRYYYSYDISTDGKQLITLYLVDNSNNQCPRGDYIKTTYDRIDR